jgi:hypothetical protein
VLYISHSCYAKDAQLLKQSFQEVTSQDHLLASKQSQQGLFANAATRNSSHSTPFIFVFC